MRVLTKASSGFGTGPGAGACPGGGAPGCSGGCKGTAGIWAAI